MKKITVFGATGMIGIPVTKELIKAGFDVTALVRNVEKAKLIFPSGVKFVKGDLDNPASIAESLKNTEGVYINISTRPDDKEHAFNPEMGGLDNILAAIKQSDAQQVAYLSSFLARNYQGDWWVMNAKKSSITKVKNCGKPYTIFYPSNFMENFANGMVRNGKITVPTTSVNNKAWWIAGEDFGRSVANAFKTEQALNKEYSVQGQEDLTMKEAAEKYASSYAQTKLKVGSMPLGVMKLLGYLVPQMKFVSKLMNVMLNNVETFEAQKTWDELGKPNLTITQFAKQA
ncbi:MAG: NmrA family NAD(P)-binding protein [Saprospiraceae bacterium]|nr:NmrA family NAD(P)-binding protein [Saprospiraceae bacterium]